MQEALPAIAQQNNKHGSSIFDVGKRGHLENVENNRIFEANNSALRRKCEDMTDSCWAGRATASLCICGSLRTLCKCVCVAVSRSGNTWSTNKDFHPCLVQQWQVSRPEACIPGEYLHIKHRPLKEENSHATQWGITHGNLGETKTFSSQLVRCVKVILLFA